MIDPDRIKTKDLAHILGISPETVRQRQIQGTFRTVGPGKYNLAEAVQAWVKYQKNDRSSDAHAKARRAVESEKYRKLKLENDMLEGKSLPTEEVKSAFSQALIVLRQHVSAIGSRVAGSITSQSDEGIIRQTINDETEKALNACETGLQDLANIGGAHTANQAENETEAF